MARIQRILVCGYYGFGNIGDEAILAVLLDDLRAVHPAATVTVLAGSPQTVASDHGVDAFGWRDMGRLVDEAERADLMVLGGGGLFQDYEGSKFDTLLTPRHGSISFYCGFGLLAGMTQTALVVYAAGVGPLHTTDGRRLTRLAVDRASAVTVRDLESKALLVEVGVDPAGVSVTADPAWLIEPASAAIVPSILSLEGVPSDARLTIGVAVRPWKANEWIDALAASLDRLVEAWDARILFVPFHDSPEPHESDAQAAVRVARRMRRIDRTHLLRGEYSAAERIAILGELDLVIGMRLHAVIFALQRGVPTVALSYDPKVRSLMDQVGLTALVVPVEDLMADAVTKAAEQAKANGGLPPKAIEEQQRSAAENRSALASDMTLPSMDDETVAAYIDLAKTIIRNQTPLESEFDESEKQRRLEIDYEQSVIDRRGLEEQLASIVDSRAFKIVGSYWESRQWLRRAARKLAARAPKALKPVFGKTGRAGPTRDAAEGAALHRQIQDQLEGVLAAYPDVPGIVVYPPSIGWNVSLFQRPQQMARAFARLGYLVLFGVDHINGEGVVGLRSVAPRIYLMAVPDEMADVLEIIPEPIAVSYVYNFAWAKNLKDPAVVFEHIDELEVFTAAYQMGSLKTWYREAIKEADLVVATARDLLEKAREERPDAVLCPNGVDYRHFADYQDNGPPADIADIVDSGQPIVGYYGAIAEWVDFDLIRTTAEALADHQFVFIGPEYDASVRHHLTVFDLPNVTWLGAKDYAELPAYLHYFDVATIPFVVDEVTHSVSPLKLFEYFAGGRPVVTPALRECSEYEAVLIAEDSADYVEKIRQAVRLRHDADHQALLRRTARANTWEMRAGTLIDALGRGGRAPG